MASVKTESRQINGKMVNVHKWRVHRKGFPAKSYTTTDKEAGRIWATEIEGKYNRGHTFVPIPSTLISEVIDDYIKFGKPSETELSRLYRVRETLGDVGVKALNSEKLAEWLVVLAKTEYRPNKFYKPSTIRKFYFTLKVVIDWHARRMRYVLLEYTWLDFKDLPSAWDPSDRRLEEGEEEAIIKACRSHLVKNRFAQVVGKKERVNGRAYALLILLALETAARSQELILAEWSEFRLDLKAWNIPIEHSKMSIARSVPLSPKALLIMETLQSLASKRSPRVFHAIPKYYKQSLKRIYVDAGVYSKGFGLHIMRHEAISRWCTKNLEMTLAQIMRISGHVSPLTFFRYDNMRAHELAHLMN
jgi:integrase